MYRTGYCCINLSLGEKFRTIKLSWAERNNKDEVDSKWLEVVTHNLTLLHKIIEWNIANKVYLYRISSDLIPFADHNSYRYLWDNFRTTRGEIIARDGTDDLVTPLREIIKRFLALGGRCTIHPSHFVSLGSVKENVRNNSIANLEYHGELLDFLGLPKNHNCPINIHVSSGTKDCDITANNVKKSLLLLSSSVIKRIVFENEQHGCWTPKKLRETFPNIPITFDYHHFKLNDGGCDLGEAARIAAESWPNNDPVQHYSEGRASELDPAHSDHIRLLPVTSADIEVEAKMKDLAIKDFLGERNKYIEGVIY